MSKPKGTTNPYASTRTNAGQTAEVPLCLTHLVAIVAALFSALSFIFDILERMIPKDGVGITVAGIVYFAVVPVGACFAAWFALSIRRLLVIIPVMTWSFFGTWAAITTFWRPGREVRWDLFIPFILLLPLLLIFATWPINWFSRHRSQPGQSQLPA